MRQKLYYAAAVFFATSSVLLMAMVDNHIIYGVMAVVCLIAMGYYSAESQKLKQIRSNADEDRPE